MNKIWFFVEGDSEELFITNLIRKKFYGKINHVKDLVEFINAKPGDSEINICYCENCHSVDKIPYRINEMNHFILKSKAVLIAIVCDIEKEKCNTNRRNVLLQKINPDVDSSIIKYVFFNPMVENHYWDSPKIIKRIIKKDYMNKFKAPLKSLNIPTTITRNHDGLKKLYKLYDLKYRESIFAGNFFPSLDYNKCSNAVLKRIINIINTYI